MATDALAAPLHFDAILHPHRSLSARGFFILMTLLCAVSFAGGIAFTLLGAWRVSCTSRFTPRLMLPALTMAHRRAAVATACSCAVSSPVVPITSALPAFAAIAACATEAAGAVKSSTTSAAANSARGSSPTSTPITSSPATDPMSRPMAGWPGRSAPPAIAAPSVDAICRSRAMPIRPAQPTTPILTDVISNP